MNHIKAEIIIPTWNSMPELKKTLESIPKAFKGYDPEIYIVDKNSSDGTKEYAEEQNCHVVIDTHSLGSARITGAKQVESDELYFVDSDIILPKNWAFDMKKYVSKYFDIGMAFGTAIDIEQKIREMQLWKMPNKPRLLKKGERAWTNNTWIKKELVLSSDVKDISGWEDWVIAQNVMDNGYKIFQFPLRCIHNHQTNSKWGFIRAGWCAKAMIEVMGFNAYSLKYIHYYPYQGLTATMQFKDLFYMNWGIRCWLEIWKGILNLKRFSRN